jgi:hypothetical protein
MPHRDCAMVNNLGNRPTRIIPPLIIKLPVTLIIFDCSVPSYGAGTPALNTIYIFSADTQCTPSWAHCWMVGVFRPYAWTPGCIRSLIHAMTSVKTPCTRSSSNKNSIVCTGVLLVIYMCSSQVVSMPAYER